MAGIRYHLIAMAILLKSAREAASPEDGARVLVERRKPGGDAQRIAGAAGLAPRNLAPAICCGTGLTKGRGNGRLFRRRYLAELCTEEAAGALSMLHEPRRRASRP